MANLQLCKLYWPREASTCAGGYIIGWNFRGFIACVAAVVPLKLSKAEEVESSLASWKSEEEVPMIIGQWVPDRSDASRMSREEEQRLDNKRQSANIWLTVIKVDGLPCLQDIYCCGYRYVRITQQIIFFDPPEEGCYLSTSSVVQSDKSGRRSKHRDRVSDMDRILRQVNCVREIKVAAASAKTSGPATAAADEAADLPAAGVLLWKKGMVCLLVTLRVLVEGLLKVLTTPLPAGLSTLKEGTMFGRVLFERLTLFCCFPFLWQAVKRDQGKTGTSARAAFVKQADTLLLGVMDAFLGVLLSAYLWTHMDYITDLATLTHMDDCLCTQVRWLMGWPAGLKLNDDLDRFLGQTFLWVVRWWQGIVSGWILPLLPLLLSAIAAMGVFGASVVVASSADLFQLLTLHVTWSDHMCTRLYKTQLGVLASLFQLFRGRKYNTLRKRIDSCNYDIDQLLLGTLVFTTGMFLFPTMAVYYFLFALVRLCIRALMATGAVLLDLVMSFPACGFLLLLYSPSRLPGGLGLEHIPVPQDARTNSKSGSITYLSLFNRPIAAKELLSPWYRVLREAAQQTRVIGPICLGQHPLLPWQAGQRHSVSGFPDTRPSFEEFWTALCDILT